MSQVKLPERKCEDRGGADARMAVEKKSRNQSIPRLYLYDAVVDHPHNSTVNHSLGKGKKMPKEESSAFATMPPKYADHDSFVDSKMPAKEQWQQLQARPNDDIETPMAPRSRAEEAMPGAVWEGENQDDDTGTITFSHTSSHRQNPSHETQDETLVTAERVQEPVLVSATRLDW